MDSPTYDITLKNKGMENIYDAHVAFGDFKSIGGIIIPDAYSVHMFVNRSIPEVATVQWRTEDNKLHSKNIYVKKMLPKDFSGGNIIFEINADKNTVLIRFESE